MRLPARALLKTVCAILELPQTSLSLATDVITANIANQLVCRLKGSDSEDNTSPPLPSTLFFNLLVLFEEAKLPSGFMVWLLR
jgi:hypothetical protein